jgi:YD repeat-containing protein
MRCSTVIAMGLAEMKITLAALSVLCLLLTSISTQAQTGLYYPTQNAYMMYFENSPNAIPKWYSGETNPDPSGACASIDAQMATIYGSWPPPGWVNASGPAIVQPLNWNWNAQLDCNWTYYTEDTNGHIYGPFPYGIYVSVFDYCPPDWTLGNNTGSWPYTCTGPGVIPAPYKEPRCPAAGNPIVLASGNKLERETDVAGLGVGGGALGFERFFGGLLMRPGGQRLSVNWTHSFSHWITNVSGASAVLVFRPNGQMYVATSPGAATAAGLQQWTLDSDVVLQVYEQINGSLQGTGWLARSLEGQEESYDTSGNLLSILDKQGRADALTYSTGSSGYALDANWNATTTVLPSGLLIDVTDSFGRSLSFGYNASLQLVQVTDPSGLNYRYTYDTSGNLSSVIYPDGKTRQYLYNEVAYTGGVSLPNALTGIVDENGTRFASYWYNSSGQATQEVHWSDTAATKAVDEYQVALNTNGTTTMTNPLNSQTTYGFQVINGVHFATSQSQPAGAGCGPASSSSSYDANGNVTSRMDFDGNVTTYSYDVTRNLETQRVEAYGTPQARTINTQWHPVFRVKAAEAAPLKLTHWIYNGQPDPTNNNAALSCAPSAALLPDGNPIAVLCKKVEQATTDGTGAAGFGATATGSPRVWTYTYNQYGQVLTATGPRGNLATSDPNYAASTTTYQYYAATDTANTPPHYQMGDLQQVTDAVGHTTTYPQYDGNGRVLQQVDSNGTTTNLTYFPRGWLATKTVTPPGSSTSQVTGYAYDGVGQLKTVTQPDDSQINYTYDAAHRLTQITDSASDSINYTLDAMGNRTQEQVKDPAGNLARQVSRVYDALNRLQTVTGGLQ